MTADDSDIWSGKVTEVGEQTLTVCLFARDGGPDVYADFHLSSLAGGGEVQPGDIIEVESGHGKPVSVRRLDLGTWTPDDLDAIRAEARRKATAIERLFEQGREI